MSPNFRQKTEEWGQVFQVFLLYFFSIAWKEGVGNKERKEGVSKMQKACGDMKRHGRVCNTINL